MSISIGRTPSHSPITPGENVTFYIISGQTNCEYASFEWYLDNIIVGTQNTITLSFDDIGEKKISVKVKEYTTPSWIGGNFYGGIFRGAFSGGTFHYGNLNDCCLISQTNDTKIFTTKI